MQSASSLLPQSTSSKMVKGGWKSAIYIIGVEVAERFAFYGTSGNLITYLTEVLHRPTVAAAKSLNIWSGAATLSPLVGAFVADTYLGRYRTILYSTFIYLMGLTMLTIAVATSIPLKYQSIMFFTALYLLAIGEGGHKPCVQALGADQFDEDNPEELRAKSSFFNWWFFGICVGASSAMIVVYYVEENVGWALGFAIPTTAMAVALLIFFIGRKNYRKPVPQGSPLVEVMQVFVAAIRKRNLSYRITGKVEMRGVAESSGDLHDGQQVAFTQQFSFLNKAAMVDEFDLSQKPKNNWRLCTMTQIEEVKLLIKLFPIWLSCLMYSVALVQSSTFFVKQGNTMDRTLLKTSFKIPSASLQVIIGLSSILLVPIYDKFLVPITRKITGLPSGITMLQRIGTGILISIISMSVAAFIETKRLKIAQNHDFSQNEDRVLPISIFWLLPQYMINGFSDVFAIVGLQELFYNQMPQGMRSLGSAAYLSIFGIGCFLSSLIISIVEKIGFLSDDLNEGHLNYFYWVLVGLSTIWFFFFLISATRFVYKETNGVSLS